MFCQLSESTKYVLCISFIFHQNHYNKTPFMPIDKSIHLIIYLNMHRFNQKQGHAVYCLQLPCGEILTVL